ncbi:MAG: peptidylprolyl isomerase [Sterolibacterium sp.]|nr:peptidylprolyl isomerase [Sterolibacterium sp.]
MPMKAILASLFHALLLAMLIPNAIAATAKPQLIDRIVAVVNEEAITANELHDRLQTVERQLRAQNIATPPRDILQKQLLERMITDRIQLQLAKESAIRVDDVQLDSYLRRIAESNQLSLAEFRHNLEQDGIIWSKFRDEVRDEMTIGRIRDREVDSRLVISDAEVDDYLATPAASSAGGEDYNVAHILIRVADRTGPEQLMLARGRAEQALTQLQRGDDFAQVAASYSDAPDAMNGGVLGPRPLDRLPPLYADALRNLQAGQVSPILQSPAGYHIIKLIDRSAAGKSIPALRQTHARHILIKVNELVPDAEAKRKAQLLKERLDKGADFAEIARSNSNDLSAAKGGDLGWLYEGDTVPEFERAMNALSVDEISAPIKSPFGWHIIQVLGRRIETTSVERQRLAARQALRESRLDEAYQDWIRQIRDAAHVEIRLDER